MKKKLNKLKSYKLPT